MMNLTFLIPIRIESEDRLKNVISSVCYLLRHIPAKVIVKEVSNKPTFKFRALPEITKYVSVDNLTYLYEESHEELFCKSKILNDLIVASDTKVVANYDADCLLPISAYHQAYGAINDGQVDVVYPYGCGIYQWRSEYPNQVYENFVNTLDVSVLDKRKVLHNSTIGWTQFVNRQKYIDSYMMNENFISWGCEDSEFYYRMSLLGNRIARIDGYIYHLEHDRTHNSWFSNPNFPNNNNLWNHIKTLDRDQLIQYYESQEYVKARREQLK